MIALLVISLCITYASAFSSMRADSRRSRMAIFVGGKGDEKKKFGIGDLFQLVTMGAGAPSLGEYERTDENGRMWFKLDANNFVDADGQSIQTKAKNFERGYVAGDDDDPTQGAPGFFENLLSGGSKMTAWQARRDAKDV